LQGTRTEQLRDWVREDPQNHQLIVFVHGFNSNKDAAWGQFPTLLKGDPDFKDFNIHRFGYPTKLCRQVSNIQNQGDLLASFLKEILTAEQPRYRQVVLVGHSMGGLVILHAFLRLERDHLEVLQDKELKVLTFGTPYLGVENTEALSLFCDNKQANNLSILNDTLGELGREWTQRYNQKPAPSGRETPQVPLYAFRGTEDRFISKTSACGYPQTPCESVDGDHDSIVKPTNRKHLSYQKLTAIAKRPKATPTAEGRISIWVARLVGDDGSHQAQRSIIRNLEFFISHEEQELQNMVEVRELPAAITGETRKDKEAEAKLVGQDHHAAIIVWGEITGLFKRDEFHPRVTLIEPLGQPTMTALLAPVTEPPQRQQLSAPPETVIVPPQPIKEPLQLVHFIVSLAFMKQQKWVEATGQLDKFMAMGPSNLLREADIYFYAGFAHSNQFEASGKPEPLDRAQVMYTQALAGYQSEKNLAGYAGVQNNLGVTYRVLAERGVEPKDNFKRSVTALEEAVRLCKEEQNWEEYALAQNSLGATYGALAEHGVEPKDNFKRSVAALKEAGGLRKKQQNWTEYVRVQNNLGLIYRLLAERGVEPEDNLKRSVTTLEEAARLGKEQQNWTGYARAKSNLGGTYLRLAQLEVEPKENLKRSVAALVEAACRFEEQQKWGNYASAQNTLGVTYRVLAERGVEPENNLKRSIATLKEVGRLCKEQQNWAEYTRAQNNLGKAYQMLAERDVEPEQNLRLANQAFKEASAHGQN
jgi:tetratricopeptide (TPR) repeat protein